MCTGFSHTFGFNATYPMISSTVDSLGYSYRDFCHYFGIPENMTFDSYHSQSGRNTLLMKTFRRYDTQYHVSSPLRIYDNPAEGSIRELKKIRYHIMHKNKVPEQLWDYVMVCISDTVNLSLSISRYVSGKTPLEYITGDTPNISEYLDLTFYDWVTYRANSLLG